MYGYLSVSLYRNLHIENCKILSTYSPYAPSPRVCARVHPSTNSSRLPFCDAILWERDIGWARAILSYWRLLRCWCMLCLCRVRAVFSLLHSVHTPLSLCNQASCNQMEKNNFLHTYCTVIVQWYQEERGKKPNNTKRNIRFNFAHLFVYNIFIYWGE